MQRSILMDGYLQVRPVCTVTATFAVTVTTACGVSGTMAIEVRPAELERHQGSLYSVTSDLTVTKHLDKVTPVCHLCVARVSV